MIRLTELRLPLEHSPAELRAAIAARLGLEPAALRGVTVFRRGHDARKKAAIVAVYTIDCEVADDGAVLARHQGDPHVRPTPDMRYRLVAQAPADFAASAAPRPIVVGFGPCGIFAALVLAQMGLRPLVLERGRAVRERTRDTWGLWRRGVLDPESNVQFGEGGAGTFSDGKLWSQISDPRHLTRKVSTSSSAPAHPKRSPGSPSRTSAPFAWSASSSACDARSSGSAARSASARASSTCASKTARCAASSSSTRRASRRTAATTMPHRRPLARRSTPRTSSSRPATARATPSRCCMRAASISKPSRSRSAFASSIRSRSSTARATARPRAIRCSAPPTTGSSITPGTAARSTASACARAERWSLRPRSATGSSPTA